VVYCPDFMTNLICFANLRERNIFWDTERNQLYWLCDQVCTTLCAIQQILGQQVINHRPIERRYEAFAVNRLPRRRITSRDPVWFSIQYYLIDTIPCMVWYGLKVWTIPINTWSVHWTRGRAAQAPDE